MRMETIVGPSEEIRKELRNIFSACGEVTRVFVPIHCEKRLPLGFAFINLKGGKGNDKALALSGSRMGGKELEVTMGTENDEYYGFTDFEGCDNCPLPVWFQQPPPTLAERIKPKAKAKGKGKRGLRRATRPSPCFI